MKERKLRHQIYLLLNNTSKLLLVVLIMLLLSFCLFKIKAEHQFKYVSNNLEDTQKELLLLQKELTRNYHVKKNKSDNNKEEIYIEKKSLLKR